ncbi:unnamed protein product [Effrenium voratum]|uniref:Uncharacterized protein n=1 Tax=Effrenium voratum TaxID=2562239 RepID=A0AA36NDT6_9DINO|nr:unnamed protein product [Effrenium voratum]
MRPLSKSASQPSMRPASALRPASAALPGVLRPCSAWTSPEMQRSETKPKLKTPTRPLQKDVPAQSLPGLPGLPARELLAFNARVWYGEAGPHRVRVLCFEDRMLEEGNALLRFAQLSHAELDAKKGVVKLRFADAFGPRSLQIELQNATDVTSLQQVVWPLLMRWLLSPKGSLQGTAGLPRGLKVCRTRRQGSPESGTLGVILSVFDAGDGLRNGLNLELQLVFMAVANPGAESALQIRLASADPHFTHQLGKPMLTQMLQDGAAPDDPHLAQLQVLGGANGVAALTEDQQLDLLIADEAGRSLYPGAHLRIFLSPFTAWTASPASSCSCLTLTQPRSISCQVLSVVPGKAFQNLLEITLPQESTDRLRLLVDCGAPSGSFFPERLAAEIRLLDGSKPHFAWASGSLISWLPVSSGAGAVTQGLGSSDPFSGAQSHLLLHFFPGATLRSAGAGDATLSLLAPEGYTLLDAECQAWYGNGTFAGCLTDSRWSCAGRSCTYNLQPYAAIWASSAVRALVTLANPAEPMRLDDDRNVWQLTMQASGFHSTQVQAVMRLQANEVSNTSRGVAVLGDLSPAFIQPTCLAASPESGPLTANWLQVFFTAAQSVHLARLLLEAHEDFSFESTACSDLPAAYYAADGHGQRTWGLPSITSCQPSGHAASITLAGALVAARRYGFQIRVFNPRRYDAAHQSSWALTSLTSAGAAVDRTSVTPGFSPSVPEAFDIYRQEMKVVTGEDDGTGSALGLEVLSGFPFWASGQEAVVRIFPLRTAVTLWGALRISAPGDYIWILEDEGLSLEGAAELPGGSPSQLANVLAWPHARYAAGTSYGFACSIRVPAVAPVTSARAFFVEFGYDQQSWDEGARLLAGRIEAPPIRALRNTQVEHLSHLQGQATRLTFQVEVVTPIQKGGALLIRSPPGFVMASPCVPRSMGFASAPTKPLPDSISCSARPLPPQTKAQGGSNQQADLALAAGSGGIDAGVYVFEVGAVNAELALQDTGDQESCANGQSCWTFFSLVDLRGESFGEFDAKSFTPGQRLKQQMPDAGLHFADGRNDRPLESNRLTFSVLLAHTSSVLILSGPDGFQLKKDCLANATDVVSIAGASLASCEATGPKARLELLAPLQAGVRYAFAVEVEANPTTTPALNSWFLETDSEASLAIASFNVQTFHGMAVTPLTPAAGSVWPDGAPNQVNISFRPQTSQTRGEGWPSLVITAPANFAFYHGNASCPQLYQAGLAQDACSGGACRCSLQEDNMLAVDFTGAGLSSNMTYILRLLTVGQASVPGGSWRLMSFQDRLGQAKLDVGEVEGFQLCSALLDLAVGVQSDKHELELVAPSEEGLALLPELVVTFTLPHPVLGGDLLRLFLPSSHRLDGGEAMCGLQWWQGAWSVLPGLVVPACTPARVQLNFTKSSEAHISAGRQLALRFSTRNPRRSFTDSFWRVEHLRHAELLAGGALQSWKVIPALSQVSVELASFAVGQRTSIIDVSFTAAGDADQLEMRGPVGFDFSNAASDRGEAASISEPRSVRVKIPMKEGEPLKLRLHHVQLPEEGGVCYFDLNALDSDGHIVARALNFTNGVAVPGRILISHIDLQSVYQSRPLQYPLQSQWPAQFSRRIVIQMDARIPSANAGEALQISGKPFQMQQGGFRVLKLGAVVPMSAPSTSGGMLTATIVEGLLPGVHQIFGMALAPAALATSERTGLKAFETRMVMCIRPEGLFGGTSRFGVSYQKPRHLLHFWQADILLVPPLQAFEWEAVAKVPAGSPSDDTCELSRQRESREELQGMLANLERQLNEAQRKRSANLAWRKSPKGGVRSSVTGLDQGFGEIRAALSCRGLKNEVVPSGNMEAQARSRIGSSAQSPDEESSAAEMFMRGAFPWAFHALGRFLENTAVKAAETLENRGTHWAAGCPARVSEAELPEMSWGTAAGAGAEARGQGKDLQNRLADEF